MPTLVNCNGGEDLYPGGCFLSVGSHVDVYFPSRKRARVNVPMVFGAGHCTQDTKPSVDILPDECLFEIFRHLYSWRERSSCACVSKRWLMILSSIRLSEFSKRGTSPSMEKADDDSIDKQVPISDVNETVSAEEEDQDIESKGVKTRCLEGKKVTDVKLAAIAVGTCSNGGLEKLSIRGSNSTHQVTDLGLSAIARGCSALCTLSLWDVSSVGNESLSEIARECHFLEKLDLCQCPLVSSLGMIAIAENCPELRVLNIESCPEVGNEGLKAIGRCCSKLQCISIRDCPLVGDHGVSSLFMSASSSSISKVKLQALNITDFSLAVIGHYGMAVTSLTFSGLRRVKEKGFWVMANAQGLRQLKSLMISSCQGVTDLSLEAFAKGCTNLKQICLRRCSSISDKGMEAFAKAAQLLECLQLEECNLVTLPGIVTALSNNL